MKILFFLLMLLSTVTALNKIIIKGNKFFDSVTGLQFYVKGISYQPSASDPILDIQGLKIDIPILKAIGINLIRCYQNDWTQDHTEGMAMLNDAGMYVMFDLGDPKLSVQYSGPWSTIVFENYRRKIDAFASYSNTFAFLAGNEVVFQPGESISAPFVKAAVRDSKAYIKAKGYNIPVGYADADVPTAAKMMDYLNCGSVDTSVDFYGLNSYSWCGDSNLQASSLDRFLNYAQYSVPYLFTEYGCNTITPRVFTEVLAIYGADLENYLSGGIVFEYTQGWNKYGLVNISSNGERTLLPDYYNFQTQINKVNPTQLTLSTYNPPAYPQQTCPAVTDPNNLSSNQNWLAAASPLPPVPNNDQCKCMYAQQQCRTNKEVLDFSVDSRPYRDEIENFKVSQCTGDSCNTVGVAPQWAVYGEWNMCNPLEQLSIVLNNDYKSSGVCATNSDIPTSVQATSYAGIDCSTLAQNYDSFSLAYPAADPVTGIPITPPSSTCDTGFSTCGTTCYDPSKYCCSGVLLLDGACSATNQNTGSGNAGNTPSTNNGNSGNTGNSGASTGNSGATTGNSGASTGNNGASTGNNSGNSGNNTGSSGTGSTGNNGNNNDNAAPTVAQRNQNSASSMFIASALFAFCLLASL